MTALLCGVALVLLLVAGYAESLACKYNSGFSYDLGYGQSILFDGDPSLNCKTTAVDACEWINHNNFTFAAWIKPYVLNNDDAGIIGDLWHQGVMQRNEGIRSTGYKQVQLFAGGDFSRAPVASVVRMQWQFIVGTFDFGDNNGTARLYVDGVERATASNLGPASVYYHEFLIGIYRDAQYTFEFAGQIDEVSVWNRALTATEIARIHETKLTGNETGLQLLWIGEGDNKTRAIDRSGHERHGKLIDGTLKELEAFRWTPDCRGCFNDSAVRCGPWKGESDVCGDGLVTGEEQCERLLDPNSTSCDDCLCENGTNPKVFGCVEDDALSCSTDNIVAYCSSYIHCSNCECARNALNCVKSLTCSAGDVPNIINIAWSTCLSTCSSDPSPCYTIVPYLAAQYREKSVCDAAGFSWCGSYCAEQAALCAEMCGNGVVDPEELCDDGNFVDDDGCSADCTVQSSGWHCIPGYACVTICADNITAGFESCDDGNLIDGDGCAANCTLEEGFTCNTTLSPTICVRNQNSDEPSELPTTAIIVASVVGALCIVVAVAAIFVWLATRKMMRVRHVSARIALSSILRPTSAAGQFDESGSQLVSTDQFPLEVTPIILEFGLKEGEKAPLDTELHDTITLHATERIKFKLFCMKSVKFDMTAFPETGTLGTGSTETISVQLTMHCTSALNLKVPLQIDKKDGGKKHIFVTVRVESRITTRLDPDEIELIEPPIGDGSYGRVYRGTFRTQDVAVKVLKVQDMSRQMTAEFMREVRIMEELRSPFVINFIGAVFFPGRLCLVTEFIPNGSLSHVMHSINLTYGFKIRACFDCAKGMAFLHSCRIMHRDLKPDNLLVSSLDEEALVVCKLTDFGTTREVGESVSANYTKNIGTPIYMAPEIVDTKHDTYSMAADVYSFGVMLYELITEKQPYSDDPRFEMSWNIAHFVASGERLAIPTTCPDEYSQLITTCWAQDSTTRPTFAVIASQLETIFGKIHPHFSSNRLPAVPSPSSASAPLPPKLTSV